MISGIRGKVSKIEKNEVLIWRDSTAHWITFLEKDREEVELKYNGSYNYIRFYVHTDIDYASSTETLYGFIQYEDYKDFRSLVSISSIGISTALSIVEKGILSELKNHLKKNEVGEARYLLVLIEGIGEDRAKKIIDGLEIKYD